MRKERPNILYFKLTGILLIPLIAITVYSFMDEFSLGELALEQADIRSHFPIPDTSEGEALFSDSTLSTIDDIMITDTASQRILLFGDSMVEGLSVRMRNYAAENRHELLNVIWYSSSTKVWAQQDTLEYYIKTFEPTYVMLCLGGNELFVHDLDKREEWIQTIIRKIGYRPFVWIGPPNWKEDTGINDLIKENVGTKRYFPSKRLTFERKEDGAHPTLVSSIQWMDSVAVWVADSAAYRIRMDFPQGTEQKGRTVTLAPLK